jgi:hypothetical protein
MTLSYISATITCDRYEDHGQKTAMLRLMLREEMSVDCRLQSINRRTINGYSYGWGSGNKQGSGIGVTNDGRGDGDVNELQHGDGHSSVNVNGDYHGDGQCTGYGNGNGRSE